MVSKRIRFVAQASGLAILLNLLNACQGQEELKFGADISFPMHHEPISNNFAWLPHNVDPSLPTPPEYKDMPIQPLGDMQDKYEHYINGCVEHYGKKGNRCYTNEEERLEMSRRQPQSVYNYTQNGFTKIRAPEHVFQLIKEFWEANKDKQQPERWQVANVYVNHWENATSLVSVENSSLEGGGYVLKQHIWNAARDTISEWTGQQVAECSLYGIRVYHEGAILSPHVDRLPLVASAIINVDQDVDEPWPLEVIGHDGLAHNVTMEPGDLVLYESHSILHSRPYPLKGRFMANVFIHFEPIGPVAGKIEYTGDLPPYLIPGSPEEPNWRLQNPNGHEIVKNRQFTTGSTDAHQHAMAGDYDALKRVLERNPDLVNVRDANGWTPLHEAVRKGDTRLVEMLLDRGAEVNARTGKDANGGSALWWAEKYHKNGEKVDDDEEKDESVLVLLRERDARRYEPEL